MSKGEARLRELILKNLMDIRAIGDPDQLIDYVDAAIEAIKKDDYFVHCGDILEVTWDNVMDWRDGKACYSLWAEDYDRDEEYEND